MKGGRKNWDEHETTTTNDTPQEGRNNRRTLLMTGGKLGCRPIALTFVDYLSILNRRARRFEQLQPETIRFIEEVERVAGAPVSLIAT